MSGISSEPAASLKRKKSLLRPIVILLLISIAVMLPALSFGEILRGQDALIHTRWQVAFAPVFWSGDVFPRWLPDLNNGFGSPAFFIYPPLSQIITAITYPMAPSADWAGFRIAVSVTVAMFVAALGTFLWLRDHTKSESAPTWGAVAYTVAPYHLFIDTYFRGAFAEVWSFAPVPFALMYVDRLLHRSYAAFPALVVSLCCVILLHAPSILITVPVVGLYATLAAWRYGTLTPVLLFLAAAAVALLLCGGYLGTALTQVNLIRSEKLFGGLLIATKWLLGGNAWPDIPIMVMIIVAMIAQIAVAIDLFRNTLSEERSSPLTSRLTFPLILMIISIAMTTVVSEPIWNLNSPLNRIQFPWRLLSLQTIAIAALSAYASDRADPTAGASGRRSVVFAIGLMVAINVALYAFCIVHGADSGKARAGLVTDSTDAPEYQLGDIKTLSARFANNSATAVLYGSGEINVTLWRPRQVELATNSLGNMRVAIRQFSYSGWRYSQDGGPERDAEILSLEEPVVVVDIPAGTHRTMISMPATMQEAVGWVISLAGFVCLILGTVALRLWHKMPTRQAISTQSTKAAQSQCSR